MSCEERLIKLQQSKHILKNDYLRLADQLNLEKWEDIFYILTNLDEMIYNYRLIKHYLQSSTSGLSIENNHIIYNIDKKINDLNTQIISDTEFHLHCPGLIPIRKQLFDNADKTGKLIHETEVVNEVKEDAKFITLEHLKSLNEALTTKTNTENPGPCKWNELPWGKDKVDIVKTAAILFYEKIQRGKYIKEKFEDDYQAKMTLPTAYYLLYHYGYREKDARCEKTLKNFNLAYREAVSKQVKDKNAFINQKLRRDNTPLSTTDLVPGIQLRDLFMKQYGSVEEPVGNYKNYTT